MKKLNDSLTSLHPRPALNPPKLITPILQNSTKNLPQVSLPPPSNSQAPTITVSLPAADPQPTKPIPILRTNSNHPRPTRAAKPLNVLIPGESTTSSHSPSFQNTPTRLSESFRHSPRFSDMPQSPGEFPRLSESPNLRVNFDLGKKEKGENATNGKEVEVEVKVETPLSKSSPEIYRRRFSDGPRPDGSLDSPRLSVTSTSPLNAVSPRLLPNPPREDSPPFPSLSETKVALRRGTSIFNKKSKKDKEKEKEKKVELGNSAELPPRLAKSTRTNTMFSLFRNNS